tara:strand:+ start:369 stop:533 length:165 start_codon:yes stop_codon:yes gene_type:complete
MKKKSAFEKLVDGVLKNESEWNKTLKDKTFRINKKDSIGEKRVKIYRYLNMYGK